MLRRLLNIASIVCRVLCVALMVMWVRSKWRDDSVDLTANAYVFSVAGVVGYISWGGSPMPKPNSSFLGFYFWTSPPKSECRVPYWFLVLTTGLLAMAFQLRWPPRFTLRTLFIATTFLAVVLGMSAWLDQWWIGK
jgi:hypothetical protein